MPTVAQADCDPSEQTVTGPLHYPDIDNCPDAEADAFGVSQSFHYQNACNMEFGDALFPIGTYPYDDWHSVEAVFCDTEYPGFTPGTAVVEVTVCCFGDDPVNPVLDLIGGPCPSLTWTLNLTGFTPGGPIALLKGSGPGSDVLTGGACAGTTTGLGGVTPITSVSADSSGNFTANPTLGGPACGTWIQAVDMSTCMTSNIFEIP